MEEEEEEEQVPASEQDSDGEEADTPTNLLISERRERGLLNLRQRPGRPWNRHSFEAPSGGPAGVRGGAICQDW